jgi:hypothetical protein
MWFKHHLLSVLQIAVIHSVQLLACVHSATVQAFFISFRSDEIVTSQIEHWHDLMWNYLTSSWFQIALMIYEWCVNYDVCVCVYKLLACLRWHSKYNVAWYKHLRQGREHWSIRGNQNTSMSVHLFSCVRLTQPCKWPIDHLCFMLPRLQIICISSQSCGLRACFTTGIRLVELNRLSASGVLLKALWQLRCRYLVHQGGKRSADRVYLS